MSENKKEAITLLSVTLAEIQAASQNELSTAEAEAIVARLRDKLAMRVNLSAWIQECKQALAVEAQYKAWFKRVDNSIWLIASVSANDLPDIDYYALFVVDTTPARAAQQALANAGWPQHA